MLLSVHGSSGPTVVASPSKVRRMSNAALMQPPGGPQPLHHVSVQMPMEDMEGWTARVLCLHHPDGRIEVFQSLC